MNQEFGEVQCPKCLTISRAADPGATQWDCPCGTSYNLRRCSACRVVSHVPALQQRNEPRYCTWCQTTNRGYSPRNDPATATLADLATDMASYGLEFVRPQLPPEQARDTQPILIVTTNEVPGHRITAVHGDVFGLVVRARNYFSNLGAQFRTLAGARLWGTPSC